MERANRLPVVLVASLLRLVVSLLLLAASFLGLQGKVSLPVGHGPVCLLDQVKLAGPHQRPEPLGSRHLLVAGSLLREQQRQLAAARSWDFPS
jgi:hypothetical protein